MKRTALILAVLFPLLAGCGPKKEDVVVSTPDGTVTASQDGSTTTVKSSTPEGETTVKVEGNNATSTVTDAQGNKSSYSVGGNVDLSKLGVDLYPGATTKDGSAGQAETPEGTSTTVTLVTGDSVDKILEFYKKKLKSPTVATMPDGGMASGTNADGDQVGIVIAKGEKGNEASITVVKKKK